jgi:hypothetical protein
MNKTIDCGACDGGLLTSPKMITCFRTWPAKYHRLSFGERCFGWKERKGYKIYYGYNNPGEKVYAEANK